MNASGIELLPANVLSKISTDCWSWTGATQSSGYGSIGLAGKTYLAHRHVYTLLVGPIPDGFEVDHLCRNPRCVNPAHLEAVPPSVNAQRRAEAYRECKRGHALEGANVRVHRRANGATTYECRACGIETQRRAAEKKAGRPVTARADRIDTIRLGASA